MCWIDVTVASNIWIRTNLIPKHTKNLGMLEYLSNLEWWGGTKNCEVFVMWFKIHPRSCVVTSNVALDGIGKRALELEK